MRLVLLHSLGGDRSSWRDEAARLLARHEVTLLDLPGHGGAAPPARYRLEEIARQLVAQLPDDVVLIGHSLGGTIAAHMAALAPVRALVIVDSTLARSTWPAEIRAQLRADLAHDRDGTLRTFYGPIAREWPLDRLVASARGVEGLVDYLDAASESDLPGSALHMPVLLQASTLLLPEGADHDRQLFLAGFQGVRDFAVDRFAHSLHWPQWDEPELWHASLDRFLGRV